MNACCQIHEAFNVRGRLAPQELMMRLSVDQTLADSVNGRMVSIADGDFGPVGTAISSWEYVVIVTLLGTTI